MAYSLKYYSEFTDILGAACMVNIEGKDYTGAASEIELADEPVVIERDSEKIMTPLCTMGCTINVWSQTNYQFEDLFLAAPRQFKVTILRKGNPVFIGYVEPGLYSEDFVPPPYVIQIGATDHLKSLENYNPSLFLNKSKTDLFTALKTCLSQSVDLPINICNTVFAGAHDTSPGKTLFEQSLMDNEGFIETKDGVSTVTDAKSILEKIMTSFGSRLYQAKGEWFVDRIRNRGRGSNTYVRTDTTGAVSIVTYNQNVALGSDVAAWYSTPSLEVEAGYAQQVVKQDLSTPETLILNNFSEGFGLWTDTAENRISRGKWYRSNEYYHLEPFSSLYDIALGFTFQHTIVGLLQSVYQLVDCSAYQGDTINISFKVAITATAGTVTKKVKISYSVFVNSEYFINTAGEVLSIYASADRKIVKELDVTEDFAGNLQASVEVRIDSKELPEGAGIIGVNKLRIILYPAESSDSGADITQSHFGDIKVAINTDHVPSNTYTAKSQKGFWKSADEITLSINDAPASVYSSGASFRNVKNILIREDTIVETSESSSFIYVVQTPLDKWYDTEIETSASGRQLAEQLLKDNFAQYYDSRAKLSGDIESDIDLSPVNLFTVEDRYGLFLMLSDKYYVQQATHNLTIMAVANIAIDLL